MATKEHEAPALPGEVWRDVVDTDGEESAVTIDATNKVRTWTKFPGQDWTRDHGRDPMTLLAWALAERARAERSETERDRLRGIIITTAKAGLSSRRRDHSEAVAALLPEVDPDPARALAILLGKVEP